VKLRDIIDKEGVEIDSRKLRRIQEEIKNNFKANCDEMVKDFMYIWNRERCSDSSRNNNQITKDEYYAVMRFVEYLKENC
jgi:hypothetical protein